MIADSVSLGTSPDQDKVLHDGGERGALIDMIDAGARNPGVRMGLCIEWGFTNSKGVSLRTFTRNFLGRSNYDRTGVSGKALRQLQRRATGFITDPTTLLHRTASSWGIDSASR